MPSLQQGLHVFRDFRLSCPSGIAHGNATLTQLNDQICTSPPHFTISLEYSCDSSRLRRRITAQQLAFINNIMYGLLLFIVEYLVVNLTVIPHETVK